MAEPGAPTKSKKSKYLKDLKRTSIFQLVLFILGMIGSVMNGDPELRWMLHMGFGVVWTDNLVLAVLFGFIYLVTKAWAPKVSGWFGRTAMSMLQWAPIAFAGYLVTFII